MKTKLFTLLFLIFSFVAIQAQDAKAILDKAWNAYNTAGGITANFTLDTKDKTAKVTYSQDGKAYMKGNKFKLEIPDGITWFDGKTQWVYMNDVNEVNVSNPTEAELQAISPISLFGIYKSGFNLVSKGAKLVNGKSVATIEMTPQKKNSDITKITVEIERSTNVFTKIVVDNKSGLQNVLTIRNYVSGVSLADATFAFDKKNYPTAEVIDLR